MDNNNKSESIPVRETWTNKLDFLLSFLGFSVGLGNVWRFPYLCYKNGGGAFLIPYFICVVAGGIPLAFLEVAVGQFMAGGGIKTWKICPLFQGIGWTSTSIIFLVSCYYAVILAWALHYLFASFTRKLPWESCGNSWNTEYCSGNIIEACNRTNNTQNYDYNTSMTESTTTNYAINCSLKVNMSVDPSTEYWEHRVLGISSGIDDVGGIRWDLTLCLLLSWIIVYLCLIKGVKSSGKVVYFTATAPYLLLLILLIRGCTLPGALDGLRFYLVPDLSKLNDMQVWADAGTQIFFSYAVGFGCLTALGSYNKWNHNCYRDVLITASMNSGTSIFSGFVIFSLLGHMAHQQGTTVDQVAESGPGLVFVVYPYALSTLPVAPLWSFLFFFTILLIGMDSQFVQVEATFTAFQDAWPKLRKKFIREGFMITVCIIQFFIGLSMVTNGGMYVFQLFDYYTGSRVIVIVTLIEVISVVWIYGVDRFYDNLEMMLGYRINLYMKICWLSLSPIFCVAIFIMSVISYSELSYKTPSGVYYYPDWAVAIGWSLACVPLVTVPVYAVYNIIRFHRAGKPLKSIIEAKDLKPHQIRANDKGALKFAENDLNFAEYTQPMIEKNLP